MKKRYFFAIKVIFTAIILLLCTSWGFFAHKEINKMAVFTLPQPLMMFYKKHIDFITQQAVNPDKRRYVVAGEAPKHYMDIEFYSDSILLRRPSWQDAKDLYPEDSMQAHGILPWNLIRLTYSLTDAFKRKDAKAVLKISADMGHYVGDLHVPLHTTKNYNGQLTGQHGIHGLWESRLPELFSASYNYYSGSAEYIKDIHKYIWNGLTQSRECVDSVLFIEKELQRKFTEDKIFSYEDRNGQTLRIYSYAFSEAYHKSLNNMVEKRMKAAIKMTGDLWYTAWVNAGKPSMAESEQPVFTVEELKETEQLKHAVPGDCSH
ncbi:MAG: zinc dependent phospholipase C family protein [Cytophaga sp.]|uniref:zinc dependent phospholipase C family protein n=1 Tax=Cytophaga sp. TaxID=29535 RepID=UPI003F7F243A